MWIVVISWIPRIVVIIVDIYQSYSIVSAHGWCNPHWLFAIQRYESPFMSDTSFYFIDTRTIGAGFISVITHWFSHLIYLNRIHTHLYGSLINNLFEYGIFIATRASANAKNTIYLAALTLSLSLQQHRKNESDFLLPLIFLTLIFTH